MKRFYRLHILIGLIAMLSIFVSPLNAQSDSCSLQAVTSSFQAAAASGAIDVWAEQYANSPCSGSIKRGVALLAQAYDLIISDDLGVSDESSEFIGNFESSTENWGGFGDASSLEWTPTGGNPNGTICAVDGSQGVWWYFDAPTSVLNLLDGAYGMALRFDIKQVEPTRLTVDNEPEDIILEAGEQRLIYNTNYNAGVTWTSYFVLLTEYGGWVDEAGVPPTSDLFQQILDNATALRIRGEFASGGDSACLDNVSLGAF